MEEKVSSPPLKHMPGTAGTGTDASCSSSTRTTCTPEGEKRGKLRGGDEGDRIPPPPLGKDKKERCKRRASGVCLEGEEERKVLYPPPPPLHFTSRGVSEQLCVCVSVGLSVPPPALSFSSPPSSVRWRHILLENTPAAYVQSGGAGKREGKSYHLLLVGRKQYFSRRCLPPPCLVWARRPFPKRAILATRHKKEEEKDCCTFLDMHA